ncbi:G-patch domain and KOW motifs-containing protein [Cataglyphis hispanica]|uniref:G-patch domain and KOW motifs-containing protein n=1 Tax=Cataglyphis hispanica TaxID=1086592 RepID=UPI00217FA1C2|nr:G-patch domain and KOW motifs-containing protein [Cataglyphis hispanica]XP_050457566.1 G-patch domain and KOW motifs-containing protein [Cataglyphis hispanica]
MEENKKISFSFVKSMKKPLLDKQIPHEEKKVEYIECLDEKAIKVIGKEEEKKEPLVIPLLKSKTWHDRIINKINADIFTQKKISKNDVSNIQEAVSDMQIKTISNDKNESILDEQAAKEIIEDLKSIEEKDKLSDLSLPLIKGQNLNGAEESMLDDYEKVPIEDFGTAMLRGMGWKSGEGIGKNPKLVTTIVPEVRPFGMGLGADKLALQKKDGKIKKEEEELKIEKGSFIKIIVGKRSNTYGQLEGFDDAGRLIIKMALNGDIISVNECIVQAVTKAEYLKNSKVLNVAKYEEHKNKEDTKKERSSDYFNSNNDNDLDVFERKRKHKKKDSVHKTKKSKERQRDSSDNDSDNKKNRKRRRSNSSDRTKKTKKSKKHKEKDKERERRSDKISESVKKKSKKHRRSRSSSRR